MSPNPNSRTSSFTDGALLARAVWDSVLKLDPRKMWKNPVMFVVEVGAVAASIDLANGVMHHADGFAFSLQITIWLWFTLLFANFAEAMAEGRGKAQAETLRKSRAETVAHRFTADGELEEVSGAKLRSGDIVLVVAGEMIPGDGEVIEGIASVDESAITGESAPVIRESGGDRSAVTGGTRVLSDQIRVKITSNPGETFIDRMIKLVEGAERQKTPNEIALNILLAGLTILFLLAVVTLQPFAVYAGAPQSLFVLVALLVCLIPDDHRRVAVGNWNRRDGSAGASKRSGHVWTSSGSGGRCGHSAPRQNGHDYVGESRGDYLCARSGRRENKTWRMRRSSLPLRMRRPKAGPSWYWRRINTDCAEEIFRRARPPLFRSPRKRGCPA